MIKEKVFLTVDTETVGLPPKNFVYDIAYTIHNKKGEIFVSRSFLVADIITDPKKMMGAFYAKKVFSYYIPSLDKGTIHLHSWESIAQQIAADVLAYNVDVITAYNARFDIGAIRSTSQLLGVGSIIPRPVLRLCIWNYACNALLNRPSYKNIAIAQGWVSAAFNYRTTAEHTYRYVSGDYDFIEQHTAIDDVMIETQILAKCFQQKKKTPYNELPAMPWKLVQDKRKVAA